MDKQSFCVIEDLEYFYAMTQFLNCLIFALINVECLVIVIESITKRN